MTLQLGLYEATDLAPRDERQLEVTDGSRQISLSSKLNYYLNRSQPYRHREIHLIKIHKNIIYANNELLTCVSLQGLKEKFL